MIAATVGGPPDESQVAAGAVVEYVERRTPTTVESPRDGIARVLGGEGDLLSHADRAALEDVADRIVDYYRAIGWPISHIARRPVSRLTTHVPPQRRSARLSCYRTARWALGGYWRTAPHLIRVRSRTLIWGRPLLHNSRGGR